MILLILVIVLIIVNIVNSISEKKNTKYIFSTLMILIIVIVVTLISANIQLHLGMVKVRRTERIKIYSTTGGNNYFGILVTVSNKSRSQHSLSYVYNSSPNNNNYVVDKYTEGTTTKIVFSNSDVAHRIRKTTKYVYKNKFWHMMFFFNSKYNNSKIINTTYLLPKNWLILNQKQVLQLQTKIENDSKFNEKLSNVNRLGKRYPRQAGVMQVVIIKKELKLK